MKIEWLPAAIANLESAVAYIGDHNPGAAEKAAKRIRNAVARLEKHPFLGRPGRVEGLRELVVHGTPYIVVYRVADNTVYIGRLLHAAQRWPPSED